MEPQEINDVFQENYELIRETISDSLGQLFRKEFSIDQTLMDESNTVIAASSQEYPRVHITFSSKARNHFKHIISVPQEPALLMYAWMIGGSEPDEEVEEAHLEGIGEAAQQLFGQVQTLMEDQGHPVFIEDMDTIAYDSVEEALADLPEEEGTNVEYNVTADDQEFSVVHHIWFVEELQDETEVNEEETQDTSNTEESEKEAQETVKAQKAEFTSIDKGNGEQGEPRNMEMLMGVELEAVVELGRKKIPIRDILRLGRGSIIELDKTAGEPLEIFVNDRKLAEGEVVVIDERFGIRITHLVSPEERIKSLQ